MKIIKNKQLLLTLNKLPFDVMLNDEKKIEIRKDSKWLHSRLFYKDGTRKEYDTIRFVNGYGSMKPNFITEYKGFYYQDFDTKIEYSNGLIVEIKKGNIIIQLGKILQTNNLKIINHGNN